MDGGELKSNAENLKENTFLSNVRAIFLAKEISVFIGELFPIWTGRSKISKLVNTIEGEKSD